MNKVQNKHGQWIWAVGQEGSEIRNKNHETFVPGLPCEPIEKPLVPFPRMGAGEIAQKLKKIFNVPHPFVQAQESAMRGRYVFDLFRFDDWLHKEHGYVEETHGSMADFVTSKWGEEATTFIRSLL
jgi:hypothetical protein